MFNKTKLKFDDIFENRLEADEIKEYLVDLYEKGETAAQIAGAASAMREHAIPLPIHYDLKEQLIDVVGTGGDHSNSFNISSTVAIILSACGSYVAKHGNRNITSKSGSADMLEALGINLSLSPEVTAKMIEETNFGFMFAQNHHPAMKHIMPIRKSINHRTIFNILGPLSNPAFVNKQLIGVFSKLYIGKIIETLNLLDTKKAMVVSSKDKMDEISISDITYANTLDNGRIQEFEINPEHYGLKLSPKEAIVGGDAKHNAHITYEIIQGNIKDAKLDIVLINTAAALIVDNKARDFQDGIQMVKEVIENKKAKKKLEQIIKFSNLY